MKKRLISLSVLIGMFFFAIFTLNIEVSTRQGINQKVHTITLPLYLKVLNFFDRHYNYQLLVKQIVAPSDNERERVMKILIWINGNIRRVPDGYPVIDDHVWHIIVRGYGTNDQSQDVFSTLCNYAGLEAFYSLVGTEGKKRTALLSFVKLDNRWSVFDAQYGVYFVNDHGEFASLDDIKAGNWKGVTLSGEPLPDHNYGDFITILPTIKSAGLCRSTIQSPLKRTLFEFKSLFDPR
ncbi:MAG: hypothetical protein ABID09_04645 [Candidatus Omnitrophota bacterium]